MNQGKPLHLQPVVTQLLSFALSAAPLVLCYPATLGQASLAHSTVPQLVPQFPHFQQQKLGETFRALFVWRASDKWRLVVNWVWHPSLVIWNPTVTTELPEQRLMQVSFCGPKHSLTQNERAPLCGRLPSQLCVLLRVVKLQRLQKGLKASLALTPQNVQQTT